MINRENTIKVFFQIQFECIRQGELLDVVSVGRAHVTLIAFAFAFLDDWHQVSVPARGGRLSDVVIDGIGIAVAAFLLTRKPEANRIRWWVWLIGAAGVIGLIGLFANFPFGSFDRG